MMFGLSAASYPSILRMYWRYNLSDWCSMMMGGITFVLAYSLGILAWKRGASGLFVTVDFLLSAVGLWHLHNRLLKIISQSTEEEETLIFQDDHTQNDKDLSSHHINNTSVKDAVSSYIQEPNILKCMKSAYCRTKSNPDEISQHNVNYEHAYQRVTESKLKPKKPNTIKCIATSSKLNNSRCSENYVGGPVPGGIHIQRARRESREDSTSNAAEGIYIPGNFAQRRYIRVRVATPDLSSASQTQANTSDENQRLNQTESSVVAENEQNSSSDHQSSAIEISNDNQNEVSRETSEREVVDTNNFPLLHTNRFKSSTANEFTPERIENEGNTASKQIQPAVLKLTPGKPPRPLPRKSPVSSSCPLESEHNTRTALQQEACNTASFQIKPSQSLNMSVPKKHLPPVPPPRPPIRDSENILSLVPVPGPSHSSQRTESSVTHQFLFSQHVPRSQSGIMTRFNFPSVTPRRFPPSLPHTSIRIRPPVPAQRTRFSNQASEEDTPPPLPPPRRKLDQL